MIIHDIGLVGKVHSKIKSDLLVALFILRSSLFPHTVTFWLSSVGRFARKGF
jgi:hypothetical protein